MAPRLLWTIAAWGLAIGTGGCESTGQGGSSCPPCECACGQSGDGRGQSTAIPASGSGAGQAGGAVDDPQGPAALKVATGAAGNGDGDGVAAATRQLSELLASASRKMFHDDGKGCLADLARIRAIDPATAARMAVTQGQCEMLVGRCQSGKARVSAWYQRETAMTKHRADASAEQLGSLRCRDGDSTARDRVLGALYELSDAAYVNPRDAGYCRSRLKIVAELLPGVPAKGPSDGQISGGKQALFHTGAACYANAGECSLAFSTYSGLFPKASLSAIKDPTVRAKAVRDSFDSSFPACTRRP